MQCATPIYATIPKFVSKISSWLPSSGPTALGKRRQDLRGSISHLAGCGSQRVAGARLCLELGFGVGGWACVCVCGGDGGGLVWLVIGKITSATYFVTIILNIQYLYIFALIIKQTHYHLYLVLL